MNFSSRSARKGCIEKVFLRQNPEQKSILFWFGKENTLFFQAKTFFDFKNIFCNSLNGVDLLNTKAVIASHVDVLTLSRINIINTACEYGIPVVWVGIYKPPQKRYWNLHIYSEKQESYSFWDFLWRLIK